MQKREAKVGVTLSHYLVMTQLAMTQLAMTQLAMTQVDDDVIQVDVKSASCFERLAFRLDLETTLSKSQAGL